MGVLTFGGVREEEIPFEYETRTTARTRRLRVTVYPGGRVVLSVPRFVSLRGAIRFLRSHSAWVLHEQERMQKVVVPEARMKGTRREYLREKETARARVHERIAHFAPRYGVTVKRVAIKNMTSRWGSCSGKGNLNFHYKVAELPPDLLDYLVVHELCHLREMNHSSRFWALVVQEIPHYQSARRRLRLLYR